MSKVQKLKEARPPKEPLKKLPQRANLKPKVHRIDAEGRILGRLATEVASLLRGKHKPNFAPNLLIGDKVIITNASKIVVTGNKMTQKLYRKHTGYPGHLKTQTMAEVYRRNPSEIIKKAIYGMLPKNKLQDKFMKNLVIYNGEETNAHR